MNIEKYTYAVVCINKAFEIIIVNHVDLISDFCVCIVFF